MPFSRTMSSPSGVTISLPISPISPGSGSGSSITRTKRRVALVGLSSAVSKGLAVTDTV